ncbi:MAG: M14 family metallopeptidase, partial [Oceanicaulis sp.]|nr:M14 family metallopeptidase [Oceanicaulis sp.]
MKHVFSLILIIGFASSLQAQIAENILTAPDGNSVTLDYYMPDGVQFDPAIPVPSDILGFEVGFRHARAEQINAYMNALAESSDRIQVEQYATSHGFRPLLLVTVSSSENMSNIEEIRTNHLKLSDPSASRDVNTSEMPLVIWQGFSVHGNEPSAANAAILLAYYLAAAQGPEIDQLLEKTVILIDPVINPDGLDRFAHWANMHVGKNLVGDPNHREHLEVWPGGRTNHYWFDLNRDWMPVQHPESRGRIAKYRDWRPNILNDYHEMGTNSPYFFQPGVPSRNFPLTPERTFELTQKIAEYHADALDEVGSLYWTRETFDDFYVGKGSTYPDINGSIGILYEQGSSRGHVQDSDFGKLTFPFTIRNQFITTLSTMRAGMDLRVDLLDHQREFFRSALSEASSSDVKAYVFG